MPRQIAKHRQSDRTVPRRRPLLGRYAAAIPTYLAAVAAFMPERSGSRFGPGSGAGSGAGVGAGQPPAQNFGSNSLLISLGQLADHGPQLSHDRIDL